MRRTTILVLADLFVLLALPMRLPAQFRIESDLAVMVDDNVFNTSSKESDRIALPSLRLGYDWESERSSTQAFYAGSFSYFNVAPDRSSHYHSAGFTYTRTFGDEGESVLTAGSTYARRFDRDAFSFYDHSQLSAYAGLKHTFSEAFLGNANYAFRSYAFRELADFDYVEHHGSVRLTIFLPTETSVNLQTDIGSKTYLTQNVTDATSSGMMGRGRRTAPQSTPSAMQLVGLIRVGQSVFEKTGLSLAVQYQYNLEKESRYLSSDFGTVSDDEIFDDHYGYEGLMSTIMLTQLLPMEMRLRVTYGAQNREYANRPAFDLQGVQIADARIDRRNYVTLQLDKEFEFLGLSALITYEYIANSSNDPLFQYTNRVITAGVSVPFQ